MDHATHHTDRGLFFEVRDPPPVGARLELTDGRVVIYQGAGPAGTLLCIDAAGGEQLVFPQDLAATGAR